MLPKEPRCQAISRCTWSVPDVVEQIEAFELCSAAPTEVCVQSWELQGDEVKSTRAETQTGREGTTLVLTTPSSFQWKKRPENGRRGKG